MNWKAWLSVLGIITLVSCVSTKKYDELAYQKRQLEAEKMDMTSQIAANERMIADLKQKETLLMQREEELKKTRSEVEGLRITHQDLMEKYDELLSQSNQVLNTK